MIKIKTLDVQGFKPAIRGMRNPYNSWAKSDSVINDYGEGTIGTNDLDLMQRLYKGGTEHRKYARMIHVWVDITAPLYFWKEFDTYKVGTTANSTSTMHTITSKKFTLDDFSYDHLTEVSELYLCDLLKLLNRYRREYLIATDQKLKKMVWWQIIQLLPSSYNQTRTIDLDYEVLIRMYEQRKDHKLDEWHDFCDWIKTLPYSDLITGEWTEFKE